MRVLSLHHHRNGVGGPPFYVAKFEGDEGYELLAVLMSTDQEEVNGTVHQSVSVAVVDPDDPGSCFRGHDYYGPGFVDALNKHYAEQGWSADWCWVLGSC